MRNIWVLYLTLIATSELSGFGLERRSSAASQADVPRRSSAAPRPAEGDAGGVPTPDEAASNLNVCGPLALSCVAIHLGRPDSYDRIFALLPPDGQPRTLLKLSEVASKIGLASRAVRWKQGKPLEFKSPAIVRLDPLSTAGIGHFIVVLRSAGGSVQILDFPNPPTWISERRLWDLWDGIALHIATSEECLPGGDDRRSRSWLPASCIAVGLLSLALLAWTGRRTTLERPRQRQGSWILVMSAIAPAIVAAPTLTRWGSDRSSPIERALIEGSPSFKTIVVDSQALKDGGKNRVPVRYLVHNRTDRAAAIARISSSCGCALPRVSSREIPAGESVEVVVEAEPLARIIQPGSNK